jgi:malate synthase
MEDYVKVGNLQVSSVLFQFINSETLPGSGLNSERFWSDFEILVNDLAPKNKAL